MSEDESQPRHFIRHPTDMPIEFDFGEVVSDKREYLENISIGGLAFHSNTAIKHGSLLLIRIPLSHPVFTAKGEVVWCRISGDHYDVGIRFLDENTAFRARMVEQVCYIQQYKDEILKKEGRILTGEEAALEWISKYATNFPR